MKNKILIIGCFLGLVHTSQLLAQAFGVKPIVYALDGEYLLSVKNAIVSKKTSLLPAYKQLLKDADKAILFGPVSVMEKTNLPPSGDKHDYMSLAPYFWPDPSKPNGEPYLRKDGETNPEVKLYKDKEYFPALCENVFTLSLAAYFSNDSKYSEHATKLLRVWFLDTATKMNPNLNFGQAIKGVNSGRGAGLIDTRHLVKLVDAIGLLNATAKLQPVELKELQNWFSNFLNWMQTSKIGIDEMNAKNNHGVWYDAQRLSFALFTDQQALAKSIVENVRKRIDNQMDKKGFFPAELERTTSLHYSLFVLDPLMSIAQMATNCNENLWQYQSPNGNSIQKGVDALIPFLVMQKKWEGAQIKPFDYNEGIPLLAISGSKYNCLQCKEAIRKIHPDKPENLRVYLLTPNDL